MANSTKKILDPTEAAMSAIQEALKMRDQEEQAARTAPKAGEDRRAAAPAISPGQPLFDSGDIGAPAADARGFAAANDDQQSIGQVLQALQHRPARTSYFVAAVFSAAWMIGCLALSFAYLGDLGGALGPGHSPIGLAVGLGAAALLPIIFFFGVAHMAWRAQELRLVAQSMAKVAMRLAEPESVARDSIVTVGQAIRREVAAMGDGVERARARATELEALVRNEVAALERTYNDNELRIRGLIQELANQRETLVGQAEQVRAAIGSVHIDLTQDLSTISDLVGQQVDEAAQRITMSLAEKGEHITGALGEIGDNVIAQLTERGEDLLVRLETASAEATQAITAASDQTNNAITGAAELLTGNLNFKTGNITDEFAAIAEGIEDMMSSRLDRVAEGFSEKSLAVVDTMFNRSQELTDAIVSTSSQMADAIASSAAEVNATLKASGESVVLDLNLRGSDVAKKIAEAGTQVTETMISRGNAVSDALHDSADKVAEAVATSGDQIKQMLAARLAAFEQTFDHSGTALTEKISRDTDTLGNLITRHLAEFDRTVKTYGSELVERLGARTKDVADSLRASVESFDDQVSTKATEVASTLDERMNRFQEAVDGSTRMVSDVLTGRVGELAQTLGTGSKEILGALERRISEATSTIDARGAKLAETLGARVEEIDRTLGGQASRVAHTIDSRIGHLEELLVGRAETLAQQIEIRSRAAAEMLGSRVDQLSDSIKTSAYQADQVLSQLTGKATDALARSTAASDAATEALTRSATDATAAINRSASTLAQAVTTSTTTAGDAISKSSAIAADTISRAAATATENIERTATEAERALTTMSTGVVRNIAGRADEITATVNQRVGDMTRLLDEKSNGLLAAIATKGQDLAGEVTRITDQTVRTIEAKGFVFAKTMVENSEGIARKINEASQQANLAMTRTLGEFQDGAQTATEAAKTTVQRTIDDLSDATKAAIEQSKQTASATVTEMMETHNMLRSDTTALFERLREANILLQEVLSGAHDNMSSLERTMATRVSDFVAAINEITAKSDKAADAVERHLTVFNTATTKTLHDLGDLAVQFDIHGRTLTDAVVQLDQSGKQTEDTITRQHDVIDGLIGVLATRSEEFEQRLQRFSALLDESLGAATERAREIAGVIADASNESVQSIERQYELVRATTEQERKRTGDALSASFDDAVQSAQLAFNQSAERFAEVMQGMKRMAGEMQHELEATRAELRRGIFELPQETADSAAQMRRVIVDQIEALAELNRIVARHGRSLETSEPAGRAAEPMRQAEPAFAAAGGRGAPRPPRAEQGAGRDVTGAPVRRGQPAGFEGGGSPQAANGGWLGDLLTRAGRDDSPPVAPPAPAPRRGDDRGQRGPIELETLASDIARMIDHDAAVELWDRYKRGERGLFTRKLYTAHGQKAFDEIRRRYRGDVEFRQSVEQYIHEFERLLDDVSRGDRGAAVARNYLTSDTGKVYTLLAHAAGRFEQDRH
jgi:uncharacterized protein YjbJ (UPF0337 family)/DNA anti-recombination protein RmuC